MELLLIVLCTAFVTSLRPTEKVRGRPIVLVGLCVVVAIGYMSQRVI